MATAQTKTVRYPTIIDFKKGNNMSLEIGRYRHYKGNEYEVMGIAKHSEDESELVVYTPLYGEQRLWVRPLQMFIETVQVNGEAKPRFEYIG